MTLPRLRRRLLGTALRRYREQAKYSCEGAAKILECDRSKISRIENGHRGISKLELRVLLTEFGVSDTEQATITAIANAAIPPWGRPAAGLFSADWQDYLALETLASHILIYCPHQLHDLLLPPGTTSAGGGPSSTDPEDTDGLRAMRTARQESIMARPCTAVSIVVGESTLLNLPDNAQRWHLNGLSLDHLSVMVQVLPARNGLLTGGLEPMTVLRFPGAPALGVVHLRRHAEDVFLTSQNDVAAYLTAFWQVKDSALPASQSVKILSDPGDSRITDICHHAESLS
jgi:transcriptional regulator with XRE-family HTH domain